MRIRPGYAAAAALVFAIEVLIALFVHDRFVRPHLGDSLAVILVHLTLRAVTPLRPVPAATVAFIIACMIEGGQYIGILSRLGLDHVAVARVVLGTGFDPTDFLAYAAGALAALAGEAILRRR